MGQIMEADFEKLNEIELIALSKKFKILSEPSRLKILKSLVNEEKCVSEIIFETKLLQANVSKQLKILYTAGILESRAEGLMRYYKVVDDTVIRICNSLCEDISAMPQ